MRSSLSQSRGSYRLQYYYYNQHNGRQRLVEATDKAYDIFLTIRAIDDIDCEDVRDFVEGLVLDGTYSNQNAREAVIQKLIDSRSECEPLMPNEGPDGCNRRWGIGTSSFSPRRCGRRPCSTATT